MIPLILSTPESMQKVRVITVKDYSNKTLEILRGKGILHVEEAKELDPVDRAALERERTLVRQSLINIHDILSYVRGEHEIDLPEGTAIPPLADIVSQTEKIRQKCTALREETTALENTISGMDQLGIYLGLLLRELDVPLRELSYSGSYVFTSVYVFSKDTHPLFRERAGDSILEQVTVTADSDVVTYVIARIDKRKDVEDTARSLGAVTLSVPAEEQTISDFLAAKKSFVEEKKNHLAALEKELDQTLDDNLEKMVLYREIVEEESERLSVIELACEAHYVNLIEGWIPESAVEKVIPTLTKELDHAFIDTRKPRRGEAPPTKFINPRGIKPFQVIVSLFSLPKYGEWDPTPLVAYFFAFFFGLMLNDVVYAAGLIATAYFFLSKLVDDPTAESFFLFRKVLYISGTTSLVMGVLSGTYLGDFLTMYFNIDLSTIALSRLIQQKLADPVAFITISLIIGLIHINAAHLLALVKGAKEGNKGIIVGKIGLFLVEIFGIPYLFRTLLHIDLLPLSAAVYSAFAYPLILGLLLIVASGFMQMGGLGSIFWVFELTGILGDVMSYSRLAGVGLATFYLASSFNLLADWLASIVSGAIPGVVGYILGLCVAIVLLVVMHIFNMLLSSLAAFIHSLRLCFVEFLLKFYEGGGIPYAPYRLKVRKHIVIGSKS